MADLKVIRLHRLEGDDKKVKAFADVSIGDFIVTGLRVVKGDNGIFLGMPQEKAKDGKWYNLFYPVTKEAKEELSELVLSAYRG